MLRCGGRNGDASRWEVAGNAMQADLHKTAIHTRLTQGAARGDIPQLGGAEGRGTVALHSSDEGLNG